MEKYGNTYLKAYCKVLVRNYPDEAFIPAVFISFIAGGTDEECEDDRIFNCRLANGEERRFKECLLHYSDA